MLAARTAPVSALGGPTLFAGQRVLPASYDANIASA